RGVQWLHETPAFPLAALAAEAGVTLDKRAADTQLRIPARIVTRPTLGQSRPGRESELEEFYAGLVRASRGIAAAEGDLNASQARPWGLREWRPTMEFLLGPFICGADLAAMAA